MLKIDISHKINQRNIEIHINDDALKFMLYKVHPA